jgi:LysM repeat protein
MQLTDNQIAGHVAAGGFTGGDRVVAIAIVLAESRGRTDAIGDTTLVTDVWGPSIGLFQIRSLNAQKGTGGVRDERANFDPATNARHAHRIFLDAGGFTPWSTFTSGSYRVFLDRARAVAPINGTMTFSPADAGGAVHVVRSGESLSGIARQHGLSLERLRALNPGLFDAAHHHGDLIHDGERVALSAPAAGPRQVVIRPGDTLGRIASAHGLSLARLRTLNPRLFDAAHHGGELVHPGEVVRL